MKKVKHGILYEPDIGRCPSCKKLMALPRLLDLDELQSCPICNASSYGFKWLADNGKSAAKRIDDFKNKVTEYDKTTKV